MRGELGDNPRRAVPVFRQRFRGVNQRDGYYCDLLSGGDTIATVEGDSVSECIEAASDWLHENRPELRL